MALCIQLFNDFETDEASSTDYYDFQILIELLGWFWDVENRLETTCYAQLGKTMLPLLEGARRCPMAIRI